LLESAGLAVEQFGGFRGQAFCWQVDLVGVVQEGQDLADDFGGKAGVEQATDLLDAVDG